MILLNNQKDAYFGGEVIEGILILDIEKPLEIRGKICIGRNACLRLHLGIYFISVVRRTKEYLALSIMVAVVVLGGVGGPHNCLGKPTAICRLLEDGRRGSHEVLAGHELTANASIGDILYMEVNAPR